MHVHGVAIPTIDGIRNVLDHIGAQMNVKQTQVLWINLREEPVTIFLLLGTIYFNCSVWKVVFADNAWLLMLIHLEMFILAVEDEENVTPRFHEEDNHLWNRLIMDAIR